MKIIALLSIILWLTYLSCNIAYGQDFEHPRGLLSKSDIPKIREKVKKEPYQSMLKNMMASYEATESKKHWKPNLDDPENTQWAYRSSELALSCAQIYLLTGDKKWAKRAKDFIIPVLNDTVEFQNPIGRGLNKCGWLLRIMQSYDYCYKAWDEAFRKEVCQKTYPVIFSVSANMGRSANYDIVSNWMGVRYGTVLYSSFIWDDFDSAPNQPDKIIPFRFDAARRVRDFAMANLHPQGWNVESTSYHLYGWSHVLPSLVAFNNVWENFAQDEPFFDRLIKNYKAWSINCLPIKNLNSRGIIPDFSDEDPNSSRRLLPFAFEFSADSLKPYFNWIHNYHSQNLSDYKALETGWFETILYHNSEIEAIKPPTSWLNFVDEGQGITLFRNRFKDENDIVSAFSATSSRKGHQGGDNLSFRIVGLGNIWAVGSGRTNLVAGQSSFFTEDISPETRYEIVTGKLLDFQFDKGSGFVIGEGSCTGVENHKRYFQVSYDSALAKAPAVFVVRDSSTNGKIWRMNTPEFNEVEILPDGFLLTAPNGSSLKAKVKNIAKENKISQGELHYGGNTIRHNLGIAFNGKRYKKTKYIDITCDKNIEVVMTLIPKGGKHPEID